MFSPLTDLTSKNFNITLLTGITLITHTDCLVNQDIFWRNKVVIITPTMITTSTTQNNGHIKNRRFCSKVINYTNATTWKLTNKRIWKFTSVILMYCIMLDTMNSWKSELKFRNELCCNRMIFLKFNFEILYKFSWNVNTSIYMHMYHNVLPKCWYICILWFPTSNSCCLIKFKSVGVF